ncbi:thiaminase II [Lactobacillus sp. M0403]|uniref:thiaminase II n=1 Tax=Lactobacillus sp. M0403 TaxID=2751031 RepID=UPI0018DDABA8|nr:thiaminase II [Lactobacillus sp. M0403]MBI0092421.1 thiaminase II [Lactobacillus sp. M0403]
MVEFTDQLHQLVSDLWIKSEKQPFIIELQSGELPLAKFRFYLLQDRYYLSEFAKIHQLIAEQTTDLNIKNFVLASAEDLQESEVEVRKQFFKELNITDDEVDTTIVAPTAYAYVNHLYLTLQRDGLEAALCAIAPCYWLYQEIGHKMAKVGSPVKYYQEWIDTYDSDWYAVNVKKLLALINQLATNVPKKELAKMKDAFLRSSYYELRFWQMAYNQEEWK